VARQVSSEGAEKLLKSSWSLSTVTIDFYAVCLVCESDVLRLAPSNADNRLYTVNPFDAFPPATEACF